MFCEELFFAGVSSPDVNWEIEFRRTQNTRAKLQTSHSETHENHAVEIFSDKFFFQKADYIHQNPVRAGIVAKAEGYLYSSASNFMDKGGLIDVEYYGTRIIDTNRKITF